MSNNGTTHGTIAIELRCKSNFFLTTRMYDIGSESF